ncbi:MAG: proton-conducting transporter membrane subunit [Chloroflexota bacterium]|nr:proton-conducting transporter membrane subunit [Chloroflexota bacterium]
MILPGPLVIIALPLAMAVVLQLLRHWTMLMAGLGAATLVLIGGLVLLAPLDAVWQVSNFTVEFGRPLVILGRQLVLQPFDQLAIAFLFFTTGGLFIVAWRLLPHSNFFPVGLVIVTLLATALLVEQVVYAALLVEMAAILTVFPLHEPSSVASKRGGAPGALGGMRYMVYVTLALPGLMITQLFLDLFAIFPNDQTLLNTAAVLLSISFAILFGAFPFQSWLSRVALDGSPPMVTFIFTVNFGAVWFMLLDYLRTYPWLAEQVPLAQLFLWLGLLMMVLGGILAAAQQQLGRLVGYATLVDNGAMLLALGTQQVEGTALAMLLLIARPFSLALMTLGLQGLRRLGDGADTHRLLRGVAWRAPWRAFAFLIGGISLAGFPISLSFDARWGLYRLLAQEEFTWALLALLGSAGVMFGLVRSLRVLLKRSPTVKRPVGEPLVEDRIVLLLLVVLILATLFLGFFPQRVSHLVYQMASWYTIF